jgi:hypothetical protein
MIGRFIIEIRDGETKRVLGRRRVRNRMVDTGLEVIKDLIGGYGFRPDVIKVGTGTTAPTAADTALGNAVFSREIDRRIPSTKKVEAQMYIATSEANGNTLAEAGLFEGATLVARALISPVIVKTVSIELTIAHEIELGYL